MDPEQENIDQIRTAFAKMQNREDFLQVLNLAKKALYGPNCNPLLLRSITYYADQRLNTNRYKEFIIRKKTGGERKIHAPQKGLKVIQRCLNFVFQVIFVPHPSATGFVPGKSIVDNAKVHAGRNYVYTTDLKDFFPGIDLYRVKAVLTISPFNLKGPEKDKLAFLIANLCCAVLEVERKDEDGNWSKKIKPVLPQGAPTSPTLTNIIANRLDRKLTGLAKKEGVNYSRYADDITFSSDHNVYSKDGKFLQELNRIITDQNFNINEKKTRLQKKQGFKQEVTGLIVNSGKVNVHRRYVKQIRHWLYFWETYGYAKAELLFRKSYIKDKGYIKVGNAPFMNVLDGKLLFLKMVKGECSQYTALNERFIKLALNTGDKIAMSKAKRNDKVQAFENEGKRLQEDASVDDIPNEFGVVSIKGREVLRKKTDFSALNLNLVLDAFLNKGFKEGVELYDKLVKNDGAGKL